jgi:hypothetical protein
MTSSHPIDSDLDFTRAVRDVLTRARALISDEDHWIQGSMSRLLTVRDPSVEYPFVITAYCASGAIALSPDTLRVPRVHATVRLAHEVDHSVRMPGPGRDELLPFTVAMAIIQRWNDESFREHDEVLGAFDRAIARVNT